MQVEPGQEFDGLVASFSSIRHGTKIIQMDALGKDESREESSGVSEAITRKEKLIFNVNQVWKWAKPHNSSLFIKDTRFTGKVWKKTKLGCVRARTETEEEIRNLYSKELLHKIMMHETWVEILL